MNEVQARPQSASSQPCIVCNGNHRFDTCDVLNNTQFIRQHYIRFCQQLRREAAARSDAFQGQAAETPMMRRPVNFLDQFEIEDENESEESDFDPSADFQEGRS